MGRARQNVVFEAGMALGLAPKSTVLVELGSVAGFSDIAGRYAVRLDGSPSQRKALLDRLGTIGCDVDLSGSHWMQVGDFGSAVATPRTYRLEREGDGLSSPKASSPASLMVSSTVTQWRPSGVSGPHPTDLVVASVMQVPAGPGISQGDHGQLATRVRGEQRKDLLARLLAKSPLTHWLERTAPSFHVAPSLPAWETTGYNTGEWSELALEPAGPEGLPPPVAAHCRVSTGWIVHGEERQPGLVLFTELQFRLLELDSVRRPSTIRHAVTPPPAPAALSLDEIFDALTAVIQSADTAAAMYAQLTGTTATTGQGAIWLTALGGAVDRVLDVTEFRLIPGSLAIGEQSIQMTLPFDATSGRLADEPGARRAAVELLGELLEKLGRRGTAERLAMLESSFAAG